MAEMYRGGSGGRSGWDWVGGCACVYAYGSWGCSLCVYVGWGVGYLCQLFGM